MRSRRSVRIIRIDPERKRIGLSLKRADGAYDALGVDFDDEMSFDEDVTEIPVAETESIESATEPVEVEEAQEDDAPLQETPEPEAV